MKLPRLLTDSAFVFTANVLRFITKAAWGILIARWLGPEYLGIYFYYLGIFSIAAVLGKFGKDSKLIKELGSSDKPKKVFLFYVHKQMVISAVLVVLSILFIALSEKNNQYFIIGICALLISYLEKSYNVFATWFLFKQKARFISRLVVMRSLLILMVGTFLYFIRVPVYLLLLIPVIFSVSRLFIMVFLLRKHYNFPPADFILQPIRISDFKFLYKETWTFGLLVVLQTINAQLNPIILKVLGFTPLDLGIVGAASRMKSIIALTGAAIYNVIFPRLVADHSSSVNKFSSTFYKILYPLLFMNIILCTFLILFAEPIILILFGDQFRESVPFMIYFSIGSIATVLMFLNSSTIAANKMRELLIFMLIITVIQQALKLTLIPVFGKIAIGYTEAAVPYLSLIGFLIILKRSVNPELGFPVYYRISLLLTLGVIAPYACLMVNLNRYLSFVVISILLILIAYKWRFLDNFNLMLQAKWVKRTNHTMNTPP